MIYDINGVSEASGGNNAIRPLETPGDLACSSQGPSLTSPPKGRFWRRWVQKETLRHGQRTKRFDPAPLGPGDVDEPLIHNPHATDEHLRGPSGEQWRSTTYRSGITYHFGDSFVRRLLLCSELVIQPQSLEFQRTPLFYRRTNRPHGGKTREKIVSSGLQTDGMWMVPEAISISPKYPTVRPVTLERTEKLGGLFAYMTSFNDLPVTRVWSAGRPPNQHPRLSRNNRLWNS